MFDDYLWIVVCGAMVAFVMAFGIGANDVANAFATSVGAKTLTMRQAILIAAVMEFAGAMLLGANVVGTIAGSIARRSAFQQDPEVLMYGMLCALTAASIWLLLATYLELPVSTTHSTVGAVMGIALAWGGAKAVVWNDSAPTEFPYVKGFVVIVISWFLSPIVSGIAAAAFFLATRTAILRRKNSFMLAFWALPAIVLLCVFIMVFFVLYKGAQKSYDFDVLFCLWISAVVAAGCAVFTVAVLLPILRRRVKKWVEEEQTKAAEAPMALTDVEKVGQVKAAGSENAAPDSMGGRFMGAATHGMDYDIFKVVDEDPLVRALHERAEKFHPHTEEAFKYLQVFTACADSFSHGANDVANSIGPFAAIWTIYKTEAVSKDSQVPKWILVLGGVGIVIGLATYGYNIMKALGVKSIAITPSRGYCIELSSALVIAAGSYLGLPLSTTHCQVGGTYGVGLVEGIGAVNVWQFAKIFAGWVMTVLFAGVLSALLFLQGTAAPGRAHARKIHGYEMGIQNVTMSTYKLMNTSNYLYVGTPLFNSTLNSTLSSNASAATKLFKKGNVQPADSLKFLRSSNSLYRTSSVLLLGNTTCKA